MADRNFELKNPPAWQYFGKDNSGRGRDLADDLVQRPVPRRDQGADADSFSGPLQGMLTSQHSCVSEVPAPVLLSDFSIELTELAPLDRQKYL